MTRKYHEGRRTRRALPGSPVRNLQIEIHPSASLFSLLSSLVVARHEAGQRPSHPLLVINAARSVCTGNFEKWPARDDSEFCAYWAISCRRAHASVEIFSETGGGVHIATSDRRPPLRDGARPFRDDLDWARPSIPPRFYGLPSPRNQSTNTHLPGGSLPPWFVRSFVRSSRKISTNRNIVRAFEHLCSFR